MTTDANHISDQEFDRLREHFDEGEVVETMPSPGLFTDFNHFNNAQQMEPTEPVKRAE